MNTEQLTPAQQVFINEMVNGASQKNAYMTAYPGSSAEAAHSSASRLMDKPHIRQRIEEEIEETNQLKKKMRERHKADRLIAISRQREALARIMFGDWSRTHSTTAGGKKTLLKTACDPNLCINAIRLDEKLTKEYDNLLAAINNKDTLQMAMEVMNTAQPLAGQYGPTPAPETENHFAQNTYQDLSIPSISYDPPAADKKTLENCGNNFNAIRETSEICLIRDSEIAQTSCNTADVAASLDAISMYDEELERLNKLYELVTAEERGNTQHRHLNRRQRRELERKQKKLVKS